MHTLNHNRCSALLNGKSLRCLRMAGVIFLLLVCACGKGGGPSPPVKGNATRSVPQGPRKEVTNSIGMRFRHIPAGTFRMGSEFGEPDELPVHAVRITKPFRLGVTEVTQNQWETVMGNKPSYIFESPDHPVEMVSWNDAAAFCRRLSETDDEYDYRLPTEAEWEYACRAGTKGDFYGPVDEIAWHLENSGDTTHRVATKRPNPWGLYDMSGNVHEWCQDWYGAEYYRDLPAKDPAGPATGERRVLRGGSVLSYPSMCRSTERSKVAPKSSSGTTFGLRVVLVDTAD